MRFSYAESMCDPTFYLPLARAAEEAGFSTYLVPDSICYPAVSDTAYPYTPDGDRGFLEDKPFIEPFSLIPAMAAVTTRLRFATFVIKLPIRSPVLVAKSATSVSVLSGERFSLGVGLSPWPEDFVVCEQQWSTRGTRANEMIEIIRGLSTGDMFSYKGRHFDLPAIKLCPTPKRPIPILVGGHSDAALARAARLGDGWMGAGWTQEELERCVARLTALRAEAGRIHLPFEIHASSIDAFSVDGIERLEALGVTDVIVGFRSPYTREPDTQTLDEKLQAIRYFGDSVIARCGR